jgi:hypothetical protein
MTLDEVLREEASKRGYSEADVERCLAYTRSLVLPGRRERRETLERELSEVEEAYVRLVWERAEIRDFGLTEKLVRRN